MLLDNGLVAQRDLDQALAFQAEMGGLLGQALLRLGAISEEDLLAALSDQLGLAIVDRAAMPATQQPVTAALALLDLKSAWLIAHQTVIWLTGGEEDEGPAHLHIAALDPLSPAVREAVDAGLWRNTPETPPQITYYLISNPDLEMLLGELAPGARDADDENLSELRLREMAEEAPVIDFVNMVFSTALRENASDIHIEPFEHAFHVRFRIDGVLRTFYSQPRNRFDPVASRVKLLSGMDIAERRLPQDGRQTVRFSGQEIDLRVSALPGSWGESLVIRLLKKEDNLPDLSGLGLIGRSRDVFIDLIREPNGILLVTGPTGSGKSTTLYRGLDEVNDGVKKIITIEDPVEYDMANVTQIQVKADIGYSFARGLRAILRQDPDVIMVGEIRDGETAQIAVQAALTGHLVLSTLHTNSALAALPRLMDMGIEPFLVAAVLRGAIGQRLVRRLCSKCAVPEADSLGEELIANAIAAGSPMAPHITGPAHWHQPAGCDACGGTGYKGRLAIFEIVATDNNFHDAIVQRASEGDLESIARSRGFLTMREDGLLKARAGLTTVSEVMRIAGDTSPASDVTLGAAE